MVRDARLRPVHAVAVAATELRSLLFAGAALAVGILTAGSGSAHAAFPGNNGVIGCSGHLADGPYPTVQMPPGFGPSLELFTMTPSGGNTTRLTNNTEADFSAKFSPDGRKIAFQRADLHLWTMDADGSNVTQLTSGAGTSTPGSWSPDGRQIVFQTSRDGNFEIYKMNADGSNQVNLTNNATPGANIDQFPAWSPDGSKIAFRSNRTGNQDIYVMNPDGSGVTNLTGDSPAEESYAAWSPDGRQIAFHSDRDAFGIGRLLNRNLEIYRMNADGSNVTRLTFNDFSAGGGGVIGGTPPADLTGYDVWPAWSPAGDRIVFQSGRAQEFRDTGQGGIVAQWEVFTIDAVHGEGVGGDLRRLTHRAGNDERCDWQPVPVTTPPAPPPPPPPPPPAAAPAPVDVQPAKMSVARATVYREDRVLDVLAPISTLTSGEVSVELQAAGRRTTFTTTIDAAQGRIRFRHAIPRSQAEMRTGILTLTYNGDADTRPQTVRLRAASERADLDLQRPTLVDGRLQASGTISAEARGVVRVQIQYVNGTRTTTRQYETPIRNGRFSLNETLSPAVLDEIRARTGTLHSYTLFTGYIKRDMRGEMRSFQVLGPR